jgi:hypothetical protein
MNERLIEVVPAMSAAYQEWLDLFEDEPVGPHLTYADLVRHIHAALAARNHDDDLVPIFAFIEDLAHHPDEDVVTVTWVTVVEGLVATADRDLLKRTIRLMGPTTRQIAHEVAEMFRHCDEIRSMLRTEDRSGAS